MHVLICKPVFSFTNVFCGIWALISPSSSSFHTRFCYDFRKVPSQIIDYSTQLRYRSTAVSVSGSFHFAACSLLGTQERAKAMHRANPLSHLPNPVFLLALSVCEAEAGVHPGGAHQTPAVDP
jgi:hypothetical protein